MCYDVWSALFLPQNERKGNRIINIQHVTELNAYNSENFYNFKLNKITLSHGVQWFKGHNECDVIRGSLQKLPLPLPEDKGNGIGAVE